MRRREGKASVWVLLALLVGAGAAGTFNYMRNLKAEQEALKHRPLHGYAESDLRHLETAYQQEVDKLSKRYQAAKASGNGGVRDHQLLGDQVREFDRVTRASDGVRDIGAALSEREVALHDVQKELQLRQGEGDATQVFLRRLLTF